jgi:hypothetical protein
MWITTAWQHIAPQVTVKGFEKCCISNAVDGHVRSECEGDEDTDCEDGDSDTVW